ncbi:protein decapentaplegic [Chironomus tepperi]|uniref:protein decapentaplegic n=1 Tax=Chironomus tepperi TaxID=113505 RepID=UPI00391F03A6
MGVKIEISEIIIIRFIIYYLMLSASCDIKLITCDIHHMIQSYYNNSRDAVMDIDTTNSLKINATELEQHIMNGLNMKTKPDVNLANISQEEYFTKYKEYLNKVNSRKKRSMKLYGDDITRTVFDDDDDEDSETFKKIFTFQYSNQSNNVGSKRRRRSTPDDDVTSLSFEIKDKKDLPTMVEEAILNVFLTNSINFKSTSANSRADTEIESDYDDSSSSSYDISPKKFTLKSNSKNTDKSHQVHIRHSESNKRQHSNRNKIHFIPNSSTIRLHVYQHEPQNGRIFLFHKDITLPISSSTDDKKIAYNKWVQLDLTSIVRTWIQGSDKELNIDVYCEMCTKYGIYIVNDASQSNKRMDESTNNPALNVIGAIVRSKRKTQNNKRKNNQDAKENQKLKKTHCRHNGEKKCCRHKWTIDFKELGGYEYIIQPRHFDAGFCDGTCPFRHNMGSNHAYFQSLAHHQLKKDDVPNVCCAPTRLQDLEILHIDENDHTKLKVTTMKKMRAMKCSCT